MIAESVAAQPDDDYQDPDLDVEQELFEFEGNDIDPEVVAGSDGAQGAKADPPKKKDPNAKAKAKAKGTRKGKKAKQRIQKRLAKMNGRSAQIAKPSR